MELINPIGWAAARGYSNGVVAEGRLVFVSGQIGCSAERVIETDDFVEQCRKALANVVAVLDCAGARPEHLVRMTWYVTNMDEYLAHARALGAAYRDIIGRHFPAMSAVATTRLVDKRAKVEIEATAVIPAAPSTLER
jgi:enamine deaminase RidA (YjgF/YER057c/UK114 family)